jgi:hypothetical protein
MMATAGRSVGRLDAAERLADLVMKTAGIWAIAGKIALVMPRESGASSNPRG